MMGRTWRWSWALVALLMVMAVGVEASAQHIKYRLQNRVALGQNPSVVLQPGEDIQRIELILKRSDGQVKKFVRKGLKAGTEVELSFKQPLGSFDYEATLKMKVDGGESVVQFAFDAVVAKRVTVKVDKGGSSLDERKVTLRADGAVTRADMVVRGDDGIIDEKKVDLTSVKPGQDIVLSWKETDAEVRKIEIKVHDPAGFWTGVELIPFTVDIPHEEVNFDTGKASFASSEARKLEDTYKLLMAEINKYGKDLEISLYVGGHTDTVGSADANRGLSRARARAISAWFRRKGLRIPIYYQGFGEGSLAVKTADNVDEPRNRRAIYILGNLAPTRGGWQRLP